MADMMAEVAGMTVLVKEFERLLSCQFRDDIACFDREAEHYRQYKMPSGSWNLLV